MKSKQKSANTVQWKVTDKKNNYYVVRPLAPTDSQKLYAFFESLSPQSKKSFQPHPFSLEFSKKMCRDADQPFHLRLVCIDPTANDQIIGYSFITIPPFFTRHGYFGIAISDEYQGRRLSTALMKRVFVSASNLGVRNIYLNVYKTNLQAIAAYQKLDFKEIAPPQFLGKIFTLYELWYNQQLGELIKPKSSSASLKDVPIWMRKQLS